MIDISQLTSLVSAFRVETEKESISPSLQKLDELLKQEISSGSVVIEKANIVGADEKLFEL